MSKYSSLDAHSRNCPSCIRQRDGDTGGGTWKKHSLPCRKLAESSGVKIKRSSSSLSSADIGDRKEESFDGSTYMTPTQRKNNEIRRLKAELNKANDIIQAKDKEIISLRNELVKHKGGLSPDNCEASSIPDSGNCDDVDSEQEPETRTALQNIDFELMESTLREEEETRLQLSTENRDLRTEQEHLELQLQELRTGHEDEVQHLQESRREQIEQMNQAHNQRLEEILAELADSALRYSRQQDLIETKQSKIDKLSEHTEGLNSQIHQLQSDTVRMSRLNSELEIDINRLKLDKENSSSIVVDKTTNNDFAVEKLEAKLEYSNTIISSLQSQISKQQEQFHQQQHQREQELQGQAEQAEAKYLKTSNVTDAAVQTSVPVCVDKVNQVDPWEEEFPGPDPSTAAATAKKDNDVRMTYQFLKRSIYYYLTDKDNKEYHLKCMERLLQFSEGEKQIIDQHKPLKKY